MGHCYCVNSSLGFGFSNLLGLSLIQTRHVANTSMLCEAVYEDNNRLQIKLGDSEALWHHGREYMAASLLLQG